VGARLAPRLDLDGESERGARQRRTAPWGAGPAAARPIRPLFTIAARALGAWRGEEAGRFGRPPQPRAPRPSAWRPSSGGLSARSPRSSARC